MGKHKNHQPDVQVEETEVVLPKVEEPELPPAVVIGTVVDCASLNVRRTPSVKATVVCEIPRGTAVTINEGKSNDEWYSVSLADGTKGFCMKKYITISQ